ncbi:myosin-xviiia [Plakobranchus ocellatus]|uniref:Myosin-xviiia n=1 Tax=Plakobranchus ocellatus TaxID=259542 RepID=A0AAV3Z879_9GAST|nr:myosin-xviiia [Plakobranchus ocellatus]
MFSFMKKDKEKDREKKQEKLDKKKKEKDEKKDKKERQPMTAEEMSRLEEMKKGVFRKFSDRDKKRNSQRSPDDDRSDSGSPQSSPVKEVKPLTKPQPLPRQQFSSSSSSSRSDKAPPAVLPKPKMKSILKGKSSNEEVSGFQKYVDLDDSKLLQENTRRNEDLFVERVPSHMAGGAPAVSNQNSRPSAGQQQSPHSSNSPTPRSDSITSSQAKTTALERNTVDGSMDLEEKENKPEPPYSSRLKLPPIIPVKPPRVREIVVHRNQTGGFGFSLRKGIIPDMSGGTPRAVTFAEPGSGSSNAQTGLLPGDRLVEVNGINIEQLPREAIVELIKKSADTMTLKVQPIPELIELSIRPNKDGLSVDIQEDTAKSGTLKRTGSLRYRKGVSSS